MVGKKEKEILAGSTDEKKKKYFIGSTQQIQQIQQEQEQQYQSHSL
jgi:hypothetical protein